MSSQVAPTITNTTAPTDTLGTFLAAHNGHPLTHVGRVTNPSLPQVNKDPRGGVPMSFNVWYCQKDHLVFLDNVS